MPCGHCTRHSGASRNLCRVETGAGIISSFRRKPESILCGTKVLRPNHRAVWTLAPSSRRITRHPAPSRNLTCGERPLTGQTILASAPSSRPKPEPGPCGHLPRHPAALPVVPAQTGTRLAGRDRSPAKPFWHQPRHPAPSRNLRRADTCPVIPPSWNLTYRHPSPFRAAIPARTTRHSSAFNPSFRRKPESNLRGATGLPGQTA